MRPMKVLQIEHDADEAEKISALFMRVRGVTFQVNTVDRLDAGLDRLAKGHIDAILLDLRLPDSQGPETFEAVRARAGQVPIVVVVDPSDTMLGIKAVEDGAHSYLVKGRIDTTQLSRAVR